MPDTITTAVPQQTPPQDAILHPAQVYFLSRRLPGIVHLVQYDQSLPYLAVELYEGDAPYTVPDGAAVNIRMAKPVPSDKKVYNPAYGISEDRHTAYIAVTPQMTVVAGCTNPVIEVVVDGGIACTGTLRLEIDPNPVQETDIIDSDEYKTLEEILAEAQAAAQIVADNEQALQDVHNNLTAIQNAAANAQAAAASAQDAEDAADRAAIESQKALGFRSYFGGQVVPDTDGDLDPSRPMSTPTAASVTIKARGDRIAGLTMAGKTTQEGMGDPSPENIRTISGVGMHDQCVVLDGRAGWAAFSRVPGVYYADISIDTTGVNGSIIKTNFKKYAHYDSMADLKQSEFAIQRPSGKTRICVRVDANSTSVQTAKDYFNSFPLTVWIRSADFYKSTGPFYTVVELSDDPYRAVGFELNAPLFQGDSLEIGGLSGFDQMVVLDGSEDEGWCAQNASNGLYRTKDNIANDMQFSSQTGNTAKSNYLRSIGASWADIKSGEFFTEALSYYVGVCISSITTLEAFKSYLSAHPLTVFYKSVNYTPENDIPVALETHQFKNVSFTGTEDWTLSGGDGLARLVIPDAKADSTAATKDECSHYNFGAVGSAAQPYAAAWSGVTAKQLVLNGEFENAQAAKAYLAAQYSAGTPVQVVYELSTPVSYARPVPAMIAQPGEDGTFTVTGENILSVLLKAFQDGGDAATLNGKKWQVFELDVPASAWTGSGTNYTAAITVSGMTAALNVLACALGSSYVGTDAAEQAMAQWDYLEIGANTVTFHAAVKPTADFGVVLTTSS